MRVLQVPNGKLWQLLTGEAAQDLVEYGLAISLIALALISGMNGVAKALVNAFTNISASVAPAAPAPTRDNDWVEPGPLYDQPGFEQAPAGYVLASWEPAHPAETGYWKRHAAAFGHSPQSVAPGDRVRFNGDCGSLRLRLADSRRSLVQEA